MSKYARFEDFQLRDKACLLGALAALGYDAAKVEEGERLALVDWHGAARPETAQIVIRRRFLGGASNDLGFEHTTKGYVPIVSDYDQRTLRQGHFLRDLRRAYAEQVAYATAKRLGMTVHKSTQGTTTKYILRPATVGLGARR